MQNQWNGPGNKNWGRNFETPGNPQPRQEYKPKVTSATPGAKYVPKGATPNCQNCAHMKLELRDTQAQLACFDMDHRCELDDLREQIDQVKRQSDVKDQDLAHLKSTIAMKDQICTDAKAELKELKALNEQLEQKSRQL